MMRTAEELRRMLGRIDRREYGAYKELRGSYGFEGFVLHIDHVQGDPFAAPSRLRAVVPQGRAAIPGDLCENPARRLGCEDFLTRAFAAAIRRWGRGRRGTGHGGIIRIDCGGQEVLPRTAMRVGQEAVEARFVAGLPAFGRRVDGRGALGLLCEEIPAIVGGSLYARALDEQGLRRHVETVEDQEALRAQLDARGLVAFVGNGAILPRRSGVDDRPLGGTGEQVVPFTSPPRLEVELLAPNRGRIRGMGIPRGVTLVAGGGFHGKSTLLRAIERGVYDHVPGDGRELVVTVAEAVKIRAEDGRRIEAVDISPFIGRLPFGRDTRTFGTDNASGSTSQAANIVEALEVGATLLLMDEDTCATNFMIRDERMQALVAKEDEPITPFVDRVRQLYSEHGVSTILVMGGAGDYLAVADLVIVLREYRPSDVTEEACAVVARLPSGRRSEAGGPMGGPGVRQPERGSFDARRGRREVKVDAKGLRRVLYGTTEIDLDALEQLVDPSQTRAIGALIHYYAERWAARAPGLRAGLEAMLREVDARGLETVTPFVLGDLARPRIFELAGAINRMRTLRVRAAPAEGAGGQSRGAAR